MRSGEELVEGKSRRRRGRKEEEKSSVRKEEWRKEGKITKNKFTH